MSEKKQRIYPYIPNSIPKVKEEMLKVIGVNSIEKLDEYLDGLRKVSEEAYSDPETVKKAPFNSVIHKINHSVSDDPEKWAITWRSYLKKKKNW